MKCPYPDCQKDYNDSEWQAWFDDYVNRTTLGHSGEDVIAGLSQHERETLNRAFITSKYCRFCHRLFHDFYVGNQVDGYKNNNEFIASYPYSRTNFKAVGVPKKIRDIFDEAQRCRGTGALIGTSACLRKTIYTLCDELSVSGADYKEKINNLPIDQTYQELLRQIKFLGDNVNHETGEQIYSKEEIDTAIEALPILIDLLYRDDEIISEAGKLLSRVRSKNTK